MTQAIVLKKIAGESTAAHESMHVAAFIYYIIKDYREKRLELLNEILDWTLSSVTIVSDEDCVGCFKHRNWGRFTEVANRYCSLAGFVGGYAFTGRTDKVSWERDLDVLRWCLHEDMDPDKLENWYETWGASEDLRKSNITCYDSQVKCITEIIDLLQHSTVFREMFVDCKEQLMSKYTLEKTELINLAQRYRDRIICETFNQRRVCVTITERGPKYDYYL